MTKPGAKRRERPVITAALMAAQQWLPEAASSDFVRGAIAAYEWMMGSSDRAPVSREIVPAVVDRIRREEDLADDVISGRPGAPEVGQDFAIGAQHALMWVRCATDDPPVGFTPAE